MSTRRLVSALIPLAAVLLLFSCTEKQDVPERICVTSADGTVLSKTVQIPLEGESSSWNVKADEDVEIFYKEPHDTAESWFCVTDISKTGTGSYKVSYTAKPRGNTLDLRSGTISMVSSEHYLGAFLSVRQGYKKVWEKTFSGGGQSILPGGSWTSETMDGISAIQDGWLSFKVKADEIPGSAGIFPLVVTLEGGAQFPDINRSSYVLDVQASENFGAESFFKLHIYNGGKVFSSESRVKFSVPVELSSVIRLGSVSVYEIPVENSGITGIPDSDE